LVTDEYMNAIFIGIVVKNIVKLTD
jgi:hypothetical protein